MELKNERRGRIKEYADAFKTASYSPVDLSSGCNPLWDIKADCAFPSATQNEINAKDAQNLVRNGIKLVAEGANMPTEPAGVDIFLENRILYCPGKAANAGGVATSGLEMTQNSMRLNWTREEVDNRLRMIMSAIHEQCVRYGEEKKKFVNYVKGANIAGFKKVADSMIDQGLV
jgi:glutamate dehydrogenase (NADP+)